MTEPIDQATKDLIEKEAEEYGYDIPSAVQGYVRGATVWAEKLKQLETQSHDQVRIIQHLEQEIAKEREMRKEMVEALAFVVEAHQTKITTVLKEVIEELIQKATLLTKDKSHE